MGTIEEFQGVLEGPKSQGVLEGPKSQGVPWDPGTPSDSPLHTVACIIPNKIQFITREREVNKG